MKSSYKRLGDFIEFYNIRAIDLESNLDIKSIRGISSISKSFIKTKANLVGVVADKYKVVTKNCFAYNPNTARMGDKIPIALNTKNEIILVSSIYPTFKIVKPNDLVPEYLMMWFKRYEFDRYARYKSHGSAREVFDSEEMNELVMPIPSIEKQQEIVREYNTIQNRIVLNNQLISKLEETAQAIYNKVVKDNQCEEYLLKDLCSFQEGYVNPSQEYANYFDGDIKWLRANDVNGGFILNTTRTLTEEGFNSAGSSALLFKPQTIVITKSGTIGRLGILCDYMCGNRAVINIKPKEDYNLPLIFFFLKSKYNELVDMAVGSAQANLYVPILASMRINLPDKKDLTHFYLASNSILELLKLKTIENQKLAKLQDLLLAKMTRVN